MLHSISVTGLLDESHFASSTILDLPSAMLNLQTDVRFRIPLPHDVEHYK